LASGEFLAVSRLRWQAPRRGPRRGRGDAGFPLCYSPGVRPTGTTVVLPHDEARPARPSAGAAARALALALTAARDLWCYQAGAVVGGRSRARAIGVLARWSRRAWPRLGLDVELRGSVPTDPLVCVANHRSYLDIPLLAGALGCTFMSRADVAGWPIVGAAAREVGVVFIDRDDPVARVRAARALIRCVRASRIVVFAEGTTTGDRLPGALHAGLFRLMHQLALPVVPVTIRYGDRRAYWVDDVAMSRHLLERVLGGPPLRAVVHVGTPLEPAAHADAEQFSRTTYAALCRPIEELGELA